MKSHELICIGKESKVCGLTVSEAASLRFAKGRESRMALLDAAPS